MRSLSLALLVLSASCAAQDGPPPPPPADPTWSSTEGPAWISYACPDGTVIWMAHRGGANSLFHSGPTGEVAVTRQRSGDEVRHTGENVVVFSEPERRYRAVVDGEEIGGGSCVDDRTATVRDRVEDLAGVWIADTRMNPKPERVGLYVPGGFESGDFRQALFVGGDRVELAATHLEQVKAFPSGAAGRQDIGMGVSPALYKRVVALQRRHAAQPLAVLVDGELVGRLVIVNALENDRVVAVVGLAEAQVRVLLSGLGG